MQNNQDTFSHVERLLGRANDYTVHAWGRIEHAFSRIEQRFLTNEARNERSRIGDEHNRLQILHRLGFIEMRINTVEALLRSAAATNAPDEKKRGTRNYRFAMWVLLVVSVWRSSDHLLQSV